MRNCNECVHVNITEEQQHKEGLNILHVCTVYWSRVLHRSQRRGHHGFLYPCEECVRDEYEHFERRGG